MADASIELTEIGVIGQGQYISVIPQFAGKLTIGLLILVLGGCGESQMEELVFRKTMEYQLKDTCGESDEVCSDTVEEQIVECLRQSGWKRYLENHENEAEQQRFVREFYPCFKDAEGNPLFA